MRMHNRDTVFDPTFDKDTVTTGPSKAALGHHLIGLIPSQKAAKTPATHTPPGP